MHVSLHSATGELVGVGDGVGLGAGVPVGVGLGVGEADGDGVGVGEGVAVGVELGDDEGEALADGVGDGKVMVKVYWHSGAGDPSIALGSAWGTVGATGACCLSLRAVSTAKIANSKVTNPRPR